jgi:hypothetical protein
MRTLFRIVLLFFVGMFGAALIAKTTLKSRGDASSEEIDLVTILGGKELVSAADPFYGGKVTTIFGGTQIDLRKAQAAPTGVSLNIAVMMGGLMLILPAGWNIEFAGQLTAGGFDDQTEPNLDPDATVVRVTGNVMFGGFQVVSRSPLEAVV